MNKLIVIIPALFACLVFSCKKDAEEQPPAVPFTFKAFLSNGDSLYFKEGITVTNSYGRAGGVIDSAGHYFEIQSTFYTAGTTKVSVYFMKTFTAQPDSGQIRNIFHTGNYAFGRSVIDSLKDGVEIIFNDLSGTKWSTAFGNQDTSSFTVTEHKENDFDNFTPYMTSGNFSCTLYDPSGNTIIITSGNFTGRTVVYP